MTERWILNASPLIVLSRVGHAHLFSLLAEEVLVPRPVADEIEAGPTVDPARRFLAAGSLPIVDPPSPPIELLAWDLGAGETAVLSYAIAHPAWTAILDDGAARRCASAFDVSLKGTLALVVLAKQQGHIPSAADLLRALRDRGFRINDALIRDVLRRTVDEPWP